MFIMHLIKMGRIYSQKKKIDSKGEREESREHLALAKEVEVLYENFY